MRALDHRQLGVDLYNATWTLLEQERPHACDDDDEMLNATHASAYHWSRAAGAGPAERCTRPVADLARERRARPRRGRAVPRRTLPASTAPRTGSATGTSRAAYEAVARAHKVAGNDAEYRRNLELGREALAQIADEEDREHIEEDLDALAS